MYGLQVKGYKWLYSNKIRRRFLDVISEFNRAFRREGTERGREWRGGLIRGLRGIYSLSIYFAYLHRLSVSWSCTN